MSRSLRHRVARRLHALAAELGGQFAAESSSSIDEPDAQAGESDASDGDDGVDPVLTPRERVLKLVARNGGGMRQQDLASELDWSESTVSRRLSRLEDAEVVSRYRIGREKLVFVDGDEPNALSTTLEPDDETDELTA